MLSSLEVKVLRSTCWRGRARKGQGLSPRGGVGRKHRANARVDGQKPGTRRERRTSGPLTAKSISIKDAKRRPGDCARKAAELTQEICSVSLRRLSMPQGILTAGQKSAEGVVGRVVGKASEALRTERWRQQIGRAGNGG